MSLNDNTGGTVVGNAGDGTTNYAPQTDASVNPSNTGTGDYSVNLSFGQQAPTTVNLASPQALEAAQEIAERTIAAGLENSRSLFDLAAQEHAGAQELARVSTATTSEQWNKSILIVGGVLIVGMAVWLYMSRGKGKST